MRKFWKAFNLEISSAAITIAVLGLIWWVTG